MNDTPSNRRAGANGFTLVEILVVLGIMAILATIAITALPSLMSAQSVTKASADISQVLDDARAYAIANHTYVFVGFEEVSAAVATSTVPQTLATSSAGGRVAVAVVASIDGTNNFESSSGTAWTPPTTTSSNLIPISQLRFFNGIHMADFSGIAAANSMNGRVAVTQANSLGFYATTGGTALFNWPVGAATASIQYSFYPNQVIQFDQEGCASLITSATYAAPSLSWLEVGLQLTHGSSVPAAPANLTTGQVVAIQIDGVTGANHVLRP